MSTPCGIEAEVLAREAQRYQAQIDRDTGALDEILADDMAYVHSSGQVDDKAAFIQWVRAVRYRAIDCSEVKVRVRGETAVVTGVARITVEREGLRRMNTLRFVNVWSRAGDGAWRNTVWQSTATAPAVAL